MMGTAIWECFFEKKLKDEKKVPNWESWFVTEETGLILPVYVDGILMKDVDLGEPTSFLDHV